jgi:hypothetical protein
MFFTSCFGSGVYVIEKDFYVAVATFVICIYVEHRNSKIKTMVMMPPALISMFSKSSFFLSSFLSGG